MLVLTGIVLVFTPLAFADGILDLLIPACCSVGISLFGARSSKVTISLLTGTVFAFTGNAVLPVVVLLMPDCCSVLIVVWGTLSSSVTISLLTAIVLAFTDPGVLIAV